MHSILRSIGILLILMGIGTSLWATDLLHHISPAIIGIGIGLLAAVPGIGVLDQEDLKRINLLPVFFTAAAISMVLAAAPTRRSGSKAPRIEVEPPVACSPKMGSE